jgi:glycosyltransferase involved in cell wall biosynthesis
MSKPKFSVVVIARNEEKTLPRLCKSLEQFFSRGGEMIVLDTGSSDKTVQVAESLGCRVVQKSFTKEFTIDEGSLLNSKFIAPGEPFIVKEGDKIFDFSKARNFATLHASNDHIFSPDCDEILTALDLDEIDRQIEAGVDRFEYDFVFSHDNQGRPLIQFMHSKFYNRKVFKWVRVVHEVLEGSGQSKYLPASVIKLEHWQNPATNRGQYLTGLAWDCYTDRSSDRNSHYFGRELYFTNRPRSAIKELRRHVAMNAWHVERAQSLIFIGKCHEQLGEPDLAAKAYNEAFALDSTRRESLLSLAELYNKLRIYEACAAFANASLVLDYKGYYCDNMSHYRDVPHRHLYYAYCWMGKIDEARKHWKMAYDFEPECPQILHDARFVFNLPKVTIIIPTLGREEKLAKCLDLIKANANYPDYEVLVKQDGYGDDNRGAIALLNEGVEEAKSELVMYLSNDCEPQPGFLIQAVLTYLEKAIGPALVALNDGIWQGRLATHWLAAKSIRDWLPDHQIFSSAYHAHGCDNELTAHCLKVHGYHYAERARVNHIDHHDDAISVMAWEHINEDRKILAERLAHYGLKDPVAV